MCSSYGFIYYVSQHLCNIRNKMFELKWFEYATIYFKPKLGQQYVYELSDNWMYRSKIKMKWQIWSMTSVIKFIGWFAGWLSHACAT